MINWAAVKFQTCRLCEEDLSEFYYYSKDRTFHPEHDVCGYCISRFETHRENQRRWQYERACDERHEILTRNLKHWNRTPQCSDEGCAGAWDEIEYFLKPGYFNLMSGGEEGVYGDLYDDPTPRDVVFAGWLCREAYSIARGQKTKMGNKRLAERAERSAV